MVSPKEQAEAYVSVGIHCCQCRCNAHLIRFGFDFVSRVGGVNGDNCGREQKSNGESGTVMVTLFIGVKAGAAPLATDIEAGADVRKQLVGDDLTGVAEPGFERDGRSPDLRGRIGNGKICDGVFSRVRLPMVVK
jgi:hypothetical protein